MLIPKKERSEKFLDLRPIALCNMLYKIVAKVLANRMKTTLPKVILEAQSAFILRRLIIDNSMITFKICHYLKRKRQDKKGV